MAVEVVIYCDECGTIGGAADTAQRARAELREKGWARVESKDWCAECQETTAFIAIMEKTIYG